jgi:bifunctional DNA-binding transcriptional regulator/antitoxin component of YhaV-PrlF toxin-antitoxin module
MTVLDKTVLKVTAKGQVTLRKDVLAHLGVRPGDKIAVQALPDGQVALKAALKKGKISDAFGCLYQEGRRAFTIDEINEAIAQGWAGER